MSLQDKKLKAEELIKALSGSIDTRTTQVKEYLNSCFNGGYPENWISWLSKRLAGLDEARIALVSEQKKLDEINSEISKIELKKEKDKINREKIAADEILSEKQLIKETREAEKAAKKAAKEAQLIAIAKSKQEEITAIQELIDRLEIEKCIVRDRFGNPNALNRIEHINNRKIPNFRKPEEKRIAAIQKKIDAITLKLEKLKANL